MTFLGLRTADTFMWRYWTSLISWYEELQFSCLFLKRQPPVGHGNLFHEVFYITHNDAPQSVGLLWTSEQLVAEAWQHTTQQTDTHASRTIRTHNLSRRAVAGLRLRPRGHWDRRQVCFGLFFTAYFNRPAPAVIFGSDKKQQSYRHLCVESKGVMEITDFDYRSIMYKN